MLAPTGGVADRLPCTALRSVPVGLEDVHAAVNPLVCIVGSMCFRHFWIFPKGVLFRDFLGPRWDRGWAQNVAPGAGFRTPEYRPNPASGGPIGGKDTF